MHISKSKWCFNKQSSTYYNSYEDKDIGKFSYLHQCTFNKIAMDYYYFIYFYSRNILIILVLGYPLSTANNPFYCLRCWKLKIALGYNPILNSLDMNLWLGLNFSVSFFLLIYSKWIWISIWPVWQIKPFVLCCSW